jgi:predicted transcriptional regulator
MATTRITITIPEALVEAADRRARTLGRSRSWVLTDALRAYVGGGRAATTTVREPPATYTPGLGASRLTQLEADLALSPEERVLAAEQSMLVPALRRRRGARRQVITFDRFEDFMAWERREALEL